MRSTLTTVLLAQDPYAGIQRLVDALAERSDISCPRVYFLSTFENLFVKMSKGEAPRTLPIDYPDSTDHIICSERNRCIVALVTANTPIIVENYVLELIKGMLLHFYDQCFATKYFTEIRKPVDFTNIDTYYKETAQLLSNALGMPMVAIRRLTADGDLECLSFFDTDGNPNTTQDFLAEEMPPPFHRVVKHTEKLIERGDLEHIEPAYHCDIDLAHPDYGFLTRNIALRKVKTFIIFPIVYGHELFGILSCACRCGYVFSELQRHAVEGIMQIVGVAISNFLRYHEAQELHVFRTEQIIDTTAVEVAKSTKHELINAQAEVSTMLVGIKRALKTNNSAKIQSAVLSLENSIDKLLPSIQKLSFGDNADRTLEKTTVKAIWSDVITLFSERLKRMGIETNFQGPDCEGYFYPEMMKNAFLNLLLNSIDAFKTHKKRGRKISVVTSLISAGQKCQIDYSDNAGGLIQTHSSYRIPEAIPKVHADMPLKELIFLPKVSSKNGLGSGWGLYLVRRAINMHRGSINLIDSKNGCTFRLDIPLHRDS